MQVSKWGDSLAVRLPKALVDKMGLRAGDELNIIDVVERIFHGRRGKYDDGLVLRMSRSCRSNGQDDQNRRKKAGHACLPANR